jgi:ATP-dependent DNA helicase RecQ
MTAERVGESRPEIDRLLHETFGHVSLRPGQGEALDSILSGSNALVVMPTGSGKSLLYQLPAMTGTGLTLVVSPLIALMKDQVDELQRKGIPAASLNSSLSRDEQMDLISRCEAGDFRLLYVAPERFRDGAFVQMVRRVHATRMVVDEAHCISQWGHDFRPDYLRLKQAREALGSPQLVALTATATLAVQEDIIASLGLEEGEVDRHVHGFSRPNLRLSVRTASRREDKDAVVRELVRSTSGPGIIYTGTRKDAEDVASLLRAIEPTTVAYHAGMDPESRSAAQEAFLSGRARVVVATNAFGMGIDKHDVRFVIHYNYPGSVEAYYQEVGRAGRDGEDAWCTLLYAPADRSLREFFIDIGNPGRDQVESVYDALWAIPDNPVLLTYAEIAARCGGGVKDGHVAKAVSLLARADFIAAYSAEPRVAITLREPGAIVLSRLRGSVQRRVLEGLASFVDVEVPGRYEAGLARLCAAAGLDDDQVRRALAAMHAEGVIEYEPPFRGRGIMKTVTERVPFHDVPIDWRRIALLRRSEEQKLEQMESFIHTRGCRFEFILRYFGETAEHVCGKCDRCAERETGAGDSVIESRPDIAMPVLVCMQSTRMTLGKNKIAEVVTGSRNARLLELRLDKNPAYGLVGAGKEQVGRVIDSLVGDGYLSVIHKDRMPMLALTARGRAAAASIEIEDFEGRERHTAARGRRAGSGAQAETGISTGARSGGRGRPPKESMDESEIRLQALRCVEELPYQLGVTKIAAVLAGTRSSWTAGEIQELSTFASVQATQARVREVLGTMVAEGLLVRDESSLRPVISLSKQGKLMLDQKSTE